MKIAHTSLLPILFSVVVLTLVGLRIDSRVAECLRAAQEAPSLASANLERMRSGNRQDLLFGLVASALALGIFTVQNSRRARRLVKATGRDRLERRRLRRTQDLARSRALAALANFGRRALEGGTLEELTALAAETASDVLGTELAGIWEWAPLEGHVSLQSGVGWRAGDFDLEQVPAEPGWLAGQVLRSRKPVTFEDLRTEERLWVPDCWREQGIVSELSVVISGPEHPYGILAVHTRKPRSFTTEDGRFLQAMANVLAEAIQRKASEMELLDAQLFAESANRAKNDFLGRMSHEIRTPVHGIIGMGELLGDSELTPEQAECLGTVQSCGATLLGLINSLLDFATIEAGRFQLERSDIDLPACLEEVAQVLAPAADRKRLALICDIPDEVRTWVRGDGERLQQVLLGLGSNAIKFTERGEVELGVELVGGTAQAQTLRFFVRDTGPGIPPDRQSSIFEEFVQGDSSATRKYGGVGLGLTIARRLVALMGGELRVKSEVDRGSLFSFLITLPKAQVPHADRRGLENMSAELLSVLADRRLLVVDGNTCRSETLARRLRAWGCRVLTAQHSRDALELLEAARAADQPVELVLLDLETAGPEGEAQARDMGEKPALGRPRMIALSSTRVQAAARADERLGAVHLGQPARQGALLEAVVRCLEPTRGELLDTGAGPGNRRSQLEALNTQVLLVATGPTESTATVGLTTALGCEVRIATSGAEAVSLYEAQAFDLVLLDLQSPEPAAAELTRELRARESSLSTHVPIIAMTTQGESTDRESCVAAGVSDFLSKPVSSEALRDVIAAWVFEDLSGHRLNDESSPSASDLLGEPGEQLEELATAPEHTPKRRQR